MASETRKQQRAQGRQAASKAPPAPTSSEAPVKAAIDKQLGADQFRSMLTRLIVPVVGVWILGGCIAAFTQTTAIRIIAIVVPVIITALAVGVVIWATRQAKKARGVASILSGVESPEDRKAALTQLETTFKKNDPTAIFARAQLEMQDDPKKALSTLEKIDLTKVMASVADEARAQRAMIHLTMGDVGPARQLVDNIELSRHRDPKTRAMLTAVSGEAWARTGNAKKAVETLGLIDPEDKEYEQLRPQLYRALAYAHAHANDLKGMRRDLKKLAQVDVRLLGGFMMKRTHPLLQKEAKRMVEQSGAVPRKMVVQRRV